LGFKYEFLVSRFEFGESRKDQKIFWPSSIAVLDLQPKRKTPQYTIMEPSTGMESVNKQAKDGASTTTISLASMCAA
jgi:hypothetical protein